MSDRYLVMLVSTAVQFRGTRIRKRLESREIELGDPLIERAGVVNRRVLFAHDYTDEEVSELQTLIDNRGLQAEALITDVFPVNWRFPLSP